MVLKVWSRGPRGFTRPLQGIYKIKAILIILLRNCLFKFSFYLECGGVSRGYMMMMHDVATNQKQIYETVVSY